MTALSRGRRPCYGSRRMTRVSHMALWLLALIVLIGVGAMPSVAQAHDGHRHGTDGRVSAGQFSAGPASVDRALPVLVVKIATAAPSAVPARMSVGTACDGPCCNPACQSGTSCCTGAGLAAESAESGPSRRPGDRALARALAARTDIVPEALPEPPRSFA